MENGNCEKHDLAWKLLIELRNEMLEFQRTRTQIVGFKITFVSAVLGLIFSNFNKMPPEIVAIPGFAAVFFDLLILGNSISIKRTGYYCRNNLEPILKEQYNWPSDKLLWEEFMNRKESREHLAFIGNLGMTTITVFVALVILFQRLPLMHVAALFVTLLGLYLFDLMTIFMPRRFRNSGF